MQKFSSLWQLCCKLRAKKGYGTSPWRVCSYSQGYHMSKCKDPMFINCIVLTCRKVQAALANAGLTSLTQIITAMPETAHIPMA